MANDEERKKLDQLVSELDISGHTQNCLRSGHIETIRDLIQKNEKDLFRIRNCGSKHVEEIKRAIARLGLSLGTKPEELGEGASRTKSDLNISFDPKVSPQQVKGDVDSQPHAFDRQRCKCGAVLLGNGTQCPSCQSTGPFEQIPWEPHPFDRRHCKCGAGLLSTETQCARCQSAGPFELIPWHRPLEPTKPKRSKAEGEKLFYCKLTISGSHYTLEIHRGSCNSCDNGYNERGGGTWGGPFHTPKAADEALNERMGWRMYDYTDCEINIVKCRCVEEFWNPYTLTWRWK